MKLDNANDPLRTFRRPASIKFIETTLQVGKPVTLICNALSVLPHNQGPDGKPLVEGKAVTGFGRLPRGVRLPTQAARA